MVSRSESFRRPRPEAHRRVGSSSLRRLPAFRVGESALVLRDIVCRPNESRRTWIYPLPFRQTPILGIHDGDVKAFRPTTQKMIVCLPYVYLWLAFSYAVHFCTATAKWM